MMQPRGNRHPFSLTPYLPPFPQKENPFWGGNCSGRLRTSTSSRGEESSSRALLTLRPHRCIPVSFSHPPSPLLDSCKVQQQRETKETGVTLCGLHYNSNNETLPPLRGSLSYKLPWATWYYQVITKTVHSYGKIITFRYQPLLPLRRRATRH